MLKIIIIYHTMARR